jgi:hypothetical protein
MDIDVFHVLARVSHNYHNYSNVTLEIVTSDAEHIIVIVRAVTVLCCCCFVSFIVK